LKITTQERNGGLFRVLEVNGENVSHLGIFTFKMHIGPAQFKMGGIGGVATNWKHRRKGYSRYVMDDTIRWMKDEGYDVTTLHGIDNFYHKFGYANCMPQCIATVRTRDAEAVCSRKPRFRARPGKDSDWPQAFRLHNSANARRSLAIVRDRASFRGLRHGSGFHRPGEWFVFETPAGRFAGYAIIDAFPEPVRACEVEVVDPSLYPDILAHLVKTAVKRRDGEIALHLPGDHPFVSYLRQFGCGVTITYKSTGAIMGRLVNQDSVLTKLAAAWAHARGSVGRPGAVTVKTDLGATKVSCPGAPSGARLSIPSMTLFQAVTGFRAVGEVLLSPEVKAARGGERVLKFLRPEFQPHMYAVDHF
jgi:hypothetical protein